ncbi:MAG: hypothetical protein M3Q48_16460 [Actinomycetota bacterium]|nr:hypothetical protein [Actinomycetota bacterium]
MPAPTRPAGPTDPGTTLHIVAWPDPVIDTLGFDPRSGYVESYWLGVLGPSTTWLMRRLAAGLDASPAGYTLDLAETARSLGLGDGGGRNSPFMRALSRCAQFDLAQAHGAGTLAVRRRVPPLSRRQVQRLPESLQASHAEWERARQRVPAVDRARIEQLAATLVELGEDVGEVERLLVRLRFEPGLAGEVARGAGSASHSAPTPPGLNGTAPVPPCVPGPADGRGL